MSSDLISRYVPASSFSSYEDFKAEFKINVPENFNFGYDVVDYYAQTQPDKVAMVWCNDSGDEETFTFSDVKRYSNRIANFLRSAGIRKGDPVMMMLKRRYEFWFCLVAMHKIGAIAVPASAMLTSRDIINRCNAIDIKMIIAADDGRLIAAVNDAQASSPSLAHKVTLRSGIDGWYDLDKEVQKASSHFERPTGDDATTNDDVLILYLTSGTTGTPKFVQHDHTYPLGHIVTAKYWQNVINDGLHLTVADTGWAKTGWGKIYGQWIAGSAVFVYDYDSKFDAQKMLSMIENYRITTFCGPATVYRMLIREDLSKYDLRHLKHLCVAGEPLYPEVFRSVEQAMGLKIHEGFGQSETTVAIANFAPWMEPRSGSMGKPSPGYNVDIIDDDGKSCLVGEEGHVVFRTDQSETVGLFCGYYGSQELTEAAWRDGIYYTGDIAYKDSDGYFWYVGRADDSIKSSGYKIGPFEVESVLLEHSAVQECAVTGVPDPIRGQIVKATIVLEPGFDGSDALVKELQNHVKKITAPYKYPRMIEFVESLPRTTSGKISRKIIKTMDIEKLAANAENEPSSV